MALSLRDVMMRPTDLETMELLMGEYTKYCIGQLDDENDVSSGEEDPRGDREYDRFPVVSGAFNVRSLSRVDFPRTWIVPKGTIPHWCYENAVAHGGTNTSLGVDYSQSRCVVCVRSELLKPSANCPGELPQKVLAVWPEERSKMHQHLTQLHQIEDHGEQRLNIPSSSIVRNPTSIRTETTSRASSPAALNENGDSVLYWPAYVTRVIGVFEDELFDGSPNSQAKLQEYENFEEIVVIALRSPMRVCVDVTFCIDEVSQAHRLTIAPSVRFRKNASRRLVSGLSGGGANTDSGSRRRSINRSRISKVNDISGGVTSTAYGGPHHHHRHRSADGNNNNNNDSNNSDSVDQEEEYDEKDEEEEEEEEEENDPEVMYESELISRNMKRNSARHHLVTKASHCPLLTPNAIPQVISIRNYSYTAVASRRRRLSIQSMDIGTESIQQHLSLPHRDPLHSARDSHAPNVRRLSVSLEGNSNPSCIISSKGKQIKNTICHAPIALDDMLAGPICQAKRFVFLRPSASLAVAAQRSAIEELRAIWIRLRKALADPSMQPPLPYSPVYHSLSPSPSLQPLLHTLYASEVQIPRLFATESVSPHPIVVPVQLPDPLLYKSPEIEVEPVLPPEILRLPEPPRMLRDLTYSVPHAESRLHTLQGHRLGPSATDGQRHIPPTLPPRSESQGLKQRQYSGRCLTRQNKSFSLYRTHNPDTDSHTQSMYSDPAEGGTEAGAAGGPSVLHRAGNTTGDMGSCQISAITTVLSVSSPCRSPPNKVESVDSAQCNRSISPLSIDIPTNLSLSVLSTNPRRSTLPLQARNEVKGSGFNVNTDPKTRHGGLVLSVTGSVAQSSCNIRRDKGELGTRREHRNREWKQQHTSTVNNNNNNNDDDSTPTLSIPLYPKPFPRSPSQSPPKSHREDQCRAFPLIMPINNRVERIPSVNGQGVSLSSMTSTAPPQSLSATARPLFPDREEEIYESEILGNRSPSPHERTTCPLGNALPMEKATEQSEAKGDIALVSSLRPVSIRSSSSGCRRSRERRPYNRFGTFIEVPTMHPYNASNLNEARSSAERNKPHTSTMTINSTCATRQSSGSGAKSSSRWYSLSSWRHASGVEVDVDDPSLLPPAVEAEAKVKAEECRSRKNYSHEWVIANPPRGMGSPSPLEESPTWRRSAESR